MDSSKEDIKTKIARINAEIRGCLLRILTIDSRAHELAILQTKEMGYPEERVDSWLECPLEAPLDWLVAIAHRLGISVEVAVIISRVDIPMN
jgi:hypothetical protein